MIAFSSSSPRSIRSDTSDGSYRDSKPENISLPIAKGQSEPNLTMASPMGSTTKGSAKARLELRRQNRRKAEEAQRLKQLRSIREANAIGIIKTQYFSLRLNLCKQILFISYLSV